MSPLYEFCFSQRGLILIPLEELDANGVSQRFADALLEADPGTQKKLDHGWLDVFNGSVQTYWRRTQALSKLSPGDWLPPRAQHVAVVTDAGKVRPFFQPIHAASWMVYAGDFDPELSNAEFGAFAFVHAERLGVTRDLVVAVVQNLSYWLNRSDESVAQFSEACHAATRPDAAGFVALAEALDWIREMYHQYLREPPEVALAALTELPRTHLRLTQQQHQWMEGLLKRWVDTSQQVASSYFRRFKAGDAAQVQEVVAWLKKRRPQLVLTDREQRVLWSQARPKTGKLKAALQGITSAAAVSMLKDLEVIDHKTRRFLGSLTDAKNLPEVHVESSTPGGLSYMHREAKRVAYNIHEAEPQRLREPAPSFERLMLGARTVHEWCHLAVDGGWVHLADDRKLDYERAFAALEQEYERVLKALPEAQQKPIEEALLQVPSAQGSAARALASIPLERMDDFLANMLGQRYMSSSESETYVRNNVHTLAFDQQTTGIMSRLARYAFEYQYLRFTSVADPMEYVLSSTWIPQQYFDPGIVSPEGFAVLCELTGNLCDCYAIDEQFFED